MIRAFSKQVEREHKNATIGHGMTWHTALPHFFLSLLRFSVYTAHEDDSGIAPMAEKPGMLGLGVRGEMRTAMGVFGSTDGCW